MVLWSPLLLPADGNFKAAQRNYSTSGTLFIARAPATSGDCGGPSETNHNDRAECGHRPAEAGPATPPATDARTTVAGTCWRTPDAPRHATSQFSSRCSWGSGCSSGGGSRRSTRWRWRSLGTGQSPARTSVGVEARAPPTRGDEEQQRDECARPG